MRKRIVNLLHREWIVANNTFIPYDFSPITSHLLSNSVTIDEFNIEKEENDELEK